MLEELKKRVYEANMLLPKHGQNALTMTAALPMHMRINITEKIF